MISEITEEKDDADSAVFLGPEAEKNRIRKIIRYQKSLLRSSSSSSSSSSISGTCSSFSSSTQRCNSLLELMRTGSSSLRRLFDMEHTSLGNYLNQYSGSPVIRTIPLWDSTSDHDSDDPRSIKREDPWASVRSSIKENAQNDPSFTGFASYGSFGDLKENEDNKGSRKKKGLTGINRRKLARKKSFRKLPGFGIFRWSGFRLRLRRLRIIICGRML